MSKRHISSEVTCPFYRSEDAQKIYCEGVEKGTAVHLAFGGVSKAKEYKSRYCCKDYDKCRIADMLYRKYEDEDE